MSNIWKRSLAMFLAIVMVLGNLPMNVLADELSGCEHSTETVTEAATCTADGYYTEVCTLCGETLVDEVLTATGHAWGDWTVTAEPEVGVEGWQERTCGTCGETEGKAIAALEPQEPEVPEDDTTGGSGGDETPDVPEDETPEVPGDDTTNVPDDDVDETAALVEEINQRVADLPTVINSEDEAYAAEAELKAIDAIVESDAFPADAYQALDWAKIEESWAAVNYYWDYVYEPVTLEVTYIDSWTENDEAAVLSNGIYSIYAPKAKYSGLTVMAPFVASLGSGDRYYKVTGSNGTSWQNSLTSYPDFTFANGVTYTAYKEVNTGKWYSPTYEWRETATFTVSLFDKLTVNTTKDGVTTTKYAKVPRGTSADVVVAEENGYSVTVSGAATGTTAGTYTLSGLTGDAEVNIVYVDANVKSKVNWTVENAEYGSVTVTANGEAITSGTELAKGTVVSFNAAPASTGVSYAVNYVDSITGVTLDANGQFVVGETDVNITVTFAKRELTGVGTEANKVTYNNFPYNQFHLGASDKVTTGMSELKTNLLDGRVAGSNTANAEDVLTADGMNMKVYYDGLGSTGWGDGWYDMPDRVFNASYEELYIIWPASGKYPEVSGYVILNMTDSRQPAGISLSKTTFSVDEMSKAADAVKGAVVVTDNKGNTVTNATVTVSLSSDAFGENVATIKVTSNGEYYVANNTGITENVTINQNKYTITWNAGEGTFKDNKKELTTDVLYGGTPAAPETPAQADSANGQYRYTFKEWTPAIAAVTGTATYTATYTATTKTYSITWDTDADGEVDATTTAEWGADPTKLTGVPAPVPGSNQSFDGWSAAGSVNTDGTIYGEATYTATFTNDTVYEVKFVVDGVQLGDTQYVNVDKDGTVAFPADPDKDYAIFNGWSNSDKIVEGVPTAKVTLEAQWNTNDENNNNIDDDDETGYVQVNKTGNGTGTVTLSGGSKITDLGNDKYEVLFNSNEGAEVTITVTATYDTKADDGDVTEATYPATVTVKDGEITPVNAEFVTHVLTLNENTKIFVNKADAGSNVAGLKAALVDVLLGKSAADADYKVEIYYPGVLSVGKKWIDTTTTDSGDQTRIAGTLGLTGDVQIRVTDLNTNVSNTIYVATADSRYVVTITVNPVPAEVKEKQNPGNIAELISAAVTATYDDPTTETVETNPVPAEDITITPTWSDDMWPADSENKTITIEAVVGSATSKVYQEKYTGTGSLYLEDTTILKTVIYTDGVADKEVFADQTIGYTEHDAEIPAFVGDPDVRTYYTFAGWSDSVVENTTTRTATWTPITDGNGNDIADEEEDFTIIYAPGYEGAENYATFTAKGGEVLPVYDADAETEGVQNPEREGWNFKGWTPALADTVIAAAEGNTITYTALWTEMWVVTFNGHTYKESVEVEDGKTVAEPVDTWDDQHDFVAWMNVKTEYDFTAPVTGNLTLTAKWINDRNYNDIEDGTANDPFHYYVWKDAEGNELNKADWLAGETEITSADYTYVEAEGDGKTFDSWATTVEGDTTTYTAVLVDDANNNEVDDAKETLTITQTGEGSFTVDGATKIGETDNYLYDSKTVTEVTVKATPVTTIENLKTYTTTYVQSITSNGTEQALTYSNFAATAKIALTGPVATAAAEEEISYQTIEVTFADAGFVYNDERLMNYYDGMPNVKNDEVYNAIVKTPELTEGAAYTIQYKARKAMSQTVQLSSLGLSDTILNILNLVGVKDFTFDMPDLWLDVNVETEGKVKDSVSLDQAVSQYLTADKITGLWDIFNDNGGLLGGGIAAVRAEIEQIYTNVYAAAMYYDAHNFGYNATGAETITEEIKITFTNEARNIVGESDITLKDMRLTSKVAAENVTVAYRDYTDEELVALINPIVTDENGNAVEGAEAICVDVIDPYTFEGKNVSNTAYELVFKFKGNETYKPSEAKVQITVKKATIESFDVPNINVTYGESYNPDPNMVLGNKYGEPKEINDSLIRFLIGLDVAELDVNNDGITGFEGKVQLMLPADLQSMLDGLLGLTGGDTSNGMEMSLSELTKYLETINDESLGDLQNVLNQIIGITEAGDITIVIGGEYPKNVGVYLHGAVTTSGNYETKFDVGYILIKPKATQVYLDWDYSDSNGVFTPELLKYVGFGASAYDDEAFTVKNEKATQDVQNLFFGFDQNGELVLTLDGYDLADKSLMNGAYTQLAFIAEFGNELYYAKPIARAFIVVPNVVDVQLVGSNGTPNNELLKEYNGEEQGFSVKVTGVNGDLIYSDHYQNIVDNLGEYDELTVTYIGLQTNTQTYNSTDKPIHAGAYAVAATYISKEANGNILAVGADMGVLVIEPTTSSVEIADVTIKEYTGEHKPVTELVDMTVTSGAGENPDMTIITAGIASTGDFSENGLEAVTGRVNVDFPKWVRDLIAQYAPSLLEGTITVAEFNDKLLNKIPDISAKLIELGATEEMANSAANLIGNVGKLLEQLPQNAELSFTPGYTVKSVGAYVVAGVVTDSDHYPSADIGVLAIVPAIENVDLKWNYEDANGIWTRELLKYVDLKASAYDENGALDADSTKLITHLFVGIDKEGNLIIEKDASKLPNGAYIEYAYIPLEVGGQMTMSNLIARPVTIIPGTAKVEFVDENGNVNHDRHFTFDGTEKAMKAVVTVNGEIVMDVTDKLTVTYIGVQTNGKEYRSTTAPIHSGVYAVVAEYRELAANGSLANIGAAVGVMAIEPTTSTIEVTGDTYTYDGNVYAATVEATSAAYPKVTTPDYTLISGYVGLNPNLETVGIESIIGNVNIQVPDWLDKVLQDTEAYKEGVTPAYLADFITSYCDDLVALIPVEEMVAMGADEAQINAAIDKLNAYIDELVAVLNKLPNTVSVTIGAHQGYTEPGVYAYYGIVTDSDHYPSHDTGLLIIEKQDWDFDLLETTRTWNGEEQFVDEVNSIGADYVTMIVDRENLNVNFILEPDAAYMVAVLEKVLGVDIPDSMDIAEIREQVDVASIAAAMDEIITELNKLDLPAEIKTGLTAIQTELATLPNAGTITIGGALPIEVGQYEVYAIAVSQYYKTQLSEDTLTIVPVKVEVNVEDNEKHYGEDDPAPISDYTLTYRDHEGNELPAPAGKVVDVALARAQGEDVGEYPITAEVKLLDEDHYEITAVDTEAIFTIKPAEYNLVVSDQTKVYGEDDPAPAYTFTKVSGELTVEEIGLAITREDPTNNNVGVYDYIVNYTESDNWIINVTDGTLEITPAPLTVTVQNAEKVYDGTDVDPEFSITAETLVNGDTLDDLDVEYVPTGAVNVNDEGYTINANVTNDNYTITVKPGTLTILPREVTVTIEKTEKYFGDPEPDYDCEVTEGTLAADETIDVLNIVTFRKPGTDVGTYTVSAEYDNDNYDVTFKNGELVINPAEIIIQVVDKERIYGDPNPEFTSIITVNAGKGTYQNDLTVEYSCDAEEKVGTHEGVIVAIPDAANKNYTVVTNTPGDLTIKPAELTVEVTKAEKFYGEEDSAIVYEYTITGQKNGDVIDTATFKRAEGADGKDVLAEGTYALVASVENENYTVKTTGTGLTIKPAEITVTVTDVEKQIGADADPEFEYTYVIDKGILTEDEIKALALEVIRKDEAPETEELEDEFALTVKHVNNDEDETNNNGNVIINVVDGTLTIGLGDYICWNVDTETYYDDVSDALTEATSGQTVQMLKDATADFNEKNEYVIVVPYGVTFDLNGHYVETKNMFCYGVVMDSAPGADEPVPGDVESEVADGTVSGGIKILNDRTKEMIQLQPSNGGWFPIYDEQTDSYKFFAALPKGSDSNVKNDTGIVIDSNDIRNSNSARVIYTFRMLFEAMEAYEVIARSDDTNFEMKLDVMWTGVDAFEITLTIPESLVVRHANEQIDRQRKRIISATLNGLQSVGSGNTISAVPFVISDTGVVITAAEEESAQVYIIP